MNGGVRRLIVPIAALLGLGAGIGVGWAAQDAPAPPPPAPAPAVTEPAPGVLPVVPPTPAVGPPERPRSRALGKPYAGRLLGGVPFPAEGIDHFTWDPVLKRSPNRLWRRYGTDRTVARILRALAAFRIGYPDAPPVGVGDLSRPRGGEFGRRFGGLGHASHQNGLDVDIYYPRKDRLLLRASSPDQVDRRLAQGLVNVFLREGASDIFTGPSLGLVGPSGIVQPLVHHDDHLHVRFAR